MIYINIPQFPTQKHRLFGFVFGDLTLSSCSNSFDKGLSLPNAINKCVER